MFSNIFQYVSSSQPVRDLLTSSGVTRFWPFGQSPQPGQQGYGLPYGVWQSVYGTPQNYIGNLPDIDNLGNQIDIYGDSASSVRDVAKAVRDAVEPYGHVVSYNGEERDAETGLYRYGFTVEFWQTH